MPMSSTSSLPDLLRRGGILAVLLVFAACTGTAPEGADEVTGTAEPAGQGTTTAIDFDCDPDDGGIELTEGFCAVVFADGLGVARHLAVDDDGDVYVQRQPVRRRGDSDDESPGGLVALRDSTGDGRADVTEDFGDIAGTGAAIHDGHLYYSSQTEVWRVALDAEALVPSAEPELIVSGFPSQGSHASKPMTFDDSGHMYVTVGGPSNACQQEGRTPGSPGQDPCPQLQWQGGIWRFDADRPGQTQEADGELYATGIRNALALDWNHAVDGLYALQHGRDQLSYLWPDVYTQEQSAELPAEEFLDVDEGDDFGWPYCYYDHVQDRKVLAPEYGGDGNEQGRCADVEGPIVAFPGHWAPNDLIFYSGQQFPEPYRGGAFVAFHGSWNRAPLEQEGYRVVFVPFDGDEPAGDWSDFATGFPQVETVETPGDAVYRPTGLAVGPDGSLFIADSRQGRIWRVIHQGS